MLSARRGQVSTRSISDIMFVIFVIIFGELSERKKIAETILKGIEPGSIPRKNETLPTVLVGPPRLKGQPTSQYTIGSAHAAASRARGSDFGDRDVGVRVKRESARGLRARIWGT